jgi:predicted pyridoxine 5'-phosphate oxidase superfamily flavin-nucleotide-binding protein
MKTAVIVLSDPRNGDEALGRVFNALALAYDLKQRKQHVEVLFQGAGTRWAAQVTSADHPVHGLYQAVADTVAGASAACADFFGAKSTPNERVRPGQRKPGAGNQRPAEPRTPGDRRLHGADLLTAAVHGEGAFHEGERALQERSGERALAVRHGAMIGDAIMEPAGAFLSAQRLLILGSRGNDGFPCVSIAFGEPGFVSAPRNDLVEIRLDRAFLDRDEASRNGLLADAEIGLLAIDLERRRRFRVNGRVERADDAGILVQVREAYPNCPKYIHRRRLTSVEPGPAEAAVRQSGRSLDAAGRALVEASDLFFIASLHPARGADVSHRGGPAGFVRVVTTTLSIPDYADGMFNSLGNCWSTNGRSRVSGLSRPPAQEDFGRADIQFDDGVEEPRRKTRRSVNVSIEGGATRRSTPRPAGRILKVQPETKEPPRARAMSKDESSIPSTFG